MVEPMGVSPVGANPDAEQDKELILSTMEDRLVEPFEMIGTRLKDLEEDLGELRDIVFKLVTGFSEGVDSYHRNTLSDEIRGKYGAELEPLDGFYKDTHDSSFSDELINSLMGEGAPDEEGRDGFIRSKIDEARGKYGKYLGGSMGAGAPAAVMVDAHEAMESPAKEAAEEAATEGMEEKPKDNVQLMIDQLTAAGGRRKASK
jgi:hypothetical protein